MLFFILKTIGGILLGLLGYSVGKDSGLAFVGFLWGLGVVFVFPAYLRVMKRILTPLLHVTLICWLAVGTGILGLIILILVLVFYLVVGWLYGLFLFIRDLIRLITGKL